MISGLYRGYSSNNYQTDKTFHVNDINLVNTDLLNHIFTPRGSRPGMRSFGTRIPLLAFQPINANTIDIIQEDLIMVATFDPRVQLIDLSVNADPDLNTISAVMTLEYIELKMVGTLPLNLVFENGATA